jgi:hypothetical protein
MLPLRYWSYAWEHETSQDSMDALPSSIVTTKQQIAVDAIMARPTHWVWVMPFLVPSAR